MGTIAGLVLIVIILIVVGYTFLVTTGYDNFNGITLQLDEMYTSTNDIIKNL